MPTYDYRCNKCGHEFELFQGITEPVRRKCPDCGRMTMKRLIGAGAGLIFKGSGFYVTDYKKSTSDSAKANGASSETPKPAKSSGDSSSSD